MLKLGLDVKLTDSDGRDALMEAITLNNPDILKLTHEYYEENKIDNWMDKHHTDAKGNSHLHLLVKPNKYGYLDNEEMLWIFLDAGLSDPDIKNQDDLTAYELACTIGNAKAKSVFESSIMGLEGELIEEAVSDDEDIDQVSVERDYQNYIKGHEKEEGKEITIPPDSTGNFGKSHSVLKTDDGDFYDVYMTKVDLKNGFYGDYVFYKL